MPLINKRIMNYLKESAFKEEFSHTILHNQDIHQIVKNTLGAKAAQAQPERSEDDVASAMSNQGSDAFHPTESGDEGEYGERLREELQGIRIQTTESSMEVEEYEQDGIDQSAFFEDKPDGQLTHEQLVAITQSEGHFRSTMVDTFGENAFNLGVPIYEAYAINSVISHDDFISQVTQHLPDPDMLSTFESICWAWFMV